MTSFYNLSERFFVKRKRLSHARVPSLTKKEDGFEIHLYQIHIVFKVDIC